MQPEEIAEMSTAPAAICAAQKGHSVFGRFILDRVLGRGGMGIVWLAHDEELQRRVALKFVPEMVARDIDAVNDLKRETRRSLDLTHHHIVRIYDFTQDELAAAIIMEYVDGETLSAIRARQAGGCLGPSQIALWAAQLCLALDYAHRNACVVHRDIKPANLMVNSRGDLKVTDFGIARSLSDSMTRVSVSNHAGTLAYMSPEQSNGESPSPADDIYAFGATLYDLLTGRPPFFRGNIQVQLDNVTAPSIASRRTELEHFGEPIPAIWEEGIAKCLSKRAADRPATILEAGQLLGILSGTAPTAAGVPHDLIPTAAPLSEVPATVARASTLSREVPAPQSTIASTASFEATQVDAALGSHVSSANELKPTVLDDVMLEVRGGATISPPRPKADAEPAAPKPAPSRSHRLLAFASILLLAGAGIAWWLLVSQETRESQASEEFVEDAPDPRVEKVSRHVTAAALALVGNDPDTASREIESIRAIDPAHEQLPALETALSHLRERLAKNEKPADSVQVAVEDAKTALNVGAPEVAETALAKVEAAAPADPRVTALRQEIAEKKRTSSSGKGSVRSSSTRTRSRPEAPKSETRPGKGPFQGTHIGG